MSQNDQTINMKLVSFQALKSAEILTRHGVFGNIDVDLESADFVHMVERHAQDTSTNALEITYRTTGVRLLVSSQIIKGSAIVTKVRVFPHPYENPKINYREISDEINLMIMGW